MESSPPAMCRILDGFAVHRHAVFCMAEWRCAVLAVGLVVFALGCGRAGPGARGLKLRAVESRSVSPAGTFELSGDALHVGAPVSVRLRGVLHAPGRADRSVHAELKGRVSSPERLTAAFDATWPALRHATFDGELEVWCDRADGAHWCGSLSAVSFEVESQLAASSDSLRRDASALVHSLGIEPSDDAPRTRGILVARVAESSVAARAGLAAGDVIEVANGVHVQALSDLAPERSAAQVRLGVRRAGRQRQLDLLLPAAAPFRDPRLLGLYCLACPVLLLLFWLSPLPRPAKLLEWLLARVDESAHARMRLTFRIGVLSACAAAAVPSMLSRQLDVFAVLSAHATLTFAAKRSGRDWSQRAGHLLMLWIGAASVAAMSGTRSWPAIVSDQGSWPWEWNALARWPTALGLAICVWHTAQLHWSRATTPGVVNALAAGLLCGLITALFLGGAHQAVVSTRTELAFTCAIAAGKSAATFCAISLVPAPKRLALRVHALWLVGLMLSACTWLCSSPTRTTEAALGGGACAFLALLTCSALLQRHIQRTRSIEQLPQPAPN